MNKYDVFKIVNELTNKISRDNLNRYIKNHFPEIYTFIYEKTKKLDKFIVEDNKNKQISIFERLYCLEHNLDDRPKCKKCNHEYVNGFDKVKNEYRKWCSPKCQASDISCINKVKQTKLKLYCDENFNGKIQAKQTRFKKYGQYHDHDFSEKVKKTKLKHFGNENFVNIEKCKQTRLEKYGDEKYNNVEKNKITRKTHTYESILKNKYVEILMSLDDFILTDKHTIYQWKCKKCGNVFFSSINYNLKKEFGSELLARCINCFPYKHISYSNIEIEISNFIKTFYKESIIRNTFNIIKPQELDIYIPEKKFAIEFDGLYWHSEEEKPDKNYHLNKTLACEKQGIQLIHIFENEWLTKQDIVKSRLKNLLGIYDKTIYARKCQIKEVESNIIKEFQNENHIQGSVNSKVNLGLYYQDELISLITFGKCRFDKKHEWELLRFCNKLGYHIPGAASKLLKHFEINYQPKSLVSYADRRWSQGKVYEKLGFKFSHASTPNYWYWRNPELLESRIKYQKHKLKSLLENFDESKTEVENMIENGYHRIFDCGNLVYEKVYEKWIS
jgi:hypothetical protein